MLHNGYCYANPYLQSSYRPNPGYYGGYPSNRRPTQQDLGSLARERERAEALAARRRRRAQYLPHEDAVDSDEDPSSSLSPRERMYLEAKRRQEALERLVAERRGKDAGGQREQDDKLAGERLRRPTDQATQQTSQKRSIPINVPGSAPRKSSDITPPQTPTPPVVEYTQAQIDAAERIQNGYRRYRALKTINDVAAQFEQAKGEFVFPDSADFVDPDQPEGVVTIPVAPALGAADVNAAMETVDNEYTVVPPTTEQPSEDAISELTHSSPSLVPSDSDDHDFEVNSSPSPSLVPSESDDHDFEVIPSADNDFEMVLSTYEDTSPSTQPDDSSNETSTPALGYTKGNYPFHAYMEKLNVLLMNLDSIQSYGSIKVRDRRREVVRMIEKEAERVESVLSDAWNHRTKQSA